MDEILQPSGLHNYKWPSDDPTKIRQSVLSRNPLTDEKLKIAATNVVFDQKAFEKNTRNKSQTEKVHFLLTSKKFQFNSTQKLKKEEIWLERLDYFIKRKQPIVIVYPLMCKIGNWAKQMTNVGPHAGELATLLFFNHLNELIKKQYAPGLEINIICDAQLYNSAFQNTEVEVNRYISQCRKLIASPLFKDFIKLHNYVDLLAGGNYFTKFLELHHTYYQKLRSPKRQEVLQSVHTETLFQSVRASINTRRMGLSYAQHMALFGNGPANIPDSLLTEVENLTQVAFNDVVAIRKACSTLNIFETLFPNNIRVTCHKGLKNGIAVIGLRTYPEYYGSSKLLPYHGVPLLKSCSYGKKIKLEIHPEITMRGNKNLVRIVDDNNCTYYYDGTILK